MEPSGPPLRLSTPWDLTSMVNPLMKNGVTQPLSECYSILPPTLAPTSNLRSIKLPGSPIVPRSPMLKLSSASSDTLLEPKTKVLSSTLISMKDSTAMLTQTSLDYGVMKTSKILYQLSHALVSPSLYLDALLFGKANSKLRSHSVAPPPSMLHSAWP